LYAFFWVIPWRLNYPEESIKHSENGRNLKSRIFPLKLFEKRNVP
jgi:hypothetical protein